MKRVIIANNLIPSTQMYFSEVDPKDVPVIEQLASIRTFSGRLISIPSTRNSIGKNPNYSPSDKCIRLLQIKPDCRVYSIPYNGSGKWGSERIYTFRLTVFDDGKFQFGQCKIRDIDAPASTLSNDVYKARNYY